MAAFSVLLGALNATNLANITTSFNATNSSGVAPLAFIAPESGLTAYYNTNNRINVTWTTPFDFTTVEVVQGPLDDGSYMRVVVAANFTRNMTSLRWDAGTVKMANVSYPVHFQLQKGHRPNDCAACIVNSADVRIYNASALSSSSSTSTSALPSTTATHLASAAAAQVSSPASKSDSRDVRLGVGIGVGLGVGLLILILGALLLAMRRRKQRRQAAERELEERQRVEAEADKLRHSSGTDSWMSGMTHKPFEFEGPNGTIRPGWESLFGGVEGLRNFLTRKNTSHRNQGRGVNR